MFLGITLPGGYVQLFNSQDDWLPGHRWNPTSTSSSEQANKDCTRLPVCPCNHSSRLGWHACKHTHTRTAFWEWTAEWQCVCQRDQNSADGGENLSIPPASPLPQSAAWNQRLWQTDTHQGTNAALIQMHLKAAAVLWVKAPVLSQRVWQRHDRWWMSTLWLQIVVAAHPVFLPLTVQQIALLNFVLFHSMNVLSPIRGFSFFRTALYFE